MAILDVVKEEKEGERKRKRPAKDVQARKIRGRPSMFMGYFQEFEPNLYHCTLCKEQESSRRRTFRRNKRGATTAFKHHIEKEHPTVWQMIKGKGKEVELVVKISEIQARKNRGRPSLFMGYFQEFEANLYYCTLCKEQEPFTIRTFRRNKEGTTTPFKRHIEKEHPSVWQMIKGKRKEVELVVGIPEIKARKNRGRPSVFMGYFHEFEANLYYCTLCKEQEPFTIHTIRRNKEGTTTPFKRHIEKEHPTVLKMIKEKGKEVQPVVGILEAAGKRSTVDYHIDKKNPGKFTYLLPCPYENSKKMIVQQVAPNGQTCAIAESPSFRELIRFYAQQNLKIPCAKMIRKYAPIFFVGERKKLVEVLKGVRSVCLTVDEWMGDSMIPLLGISVHWISDSWELLQRVLAVKKIDGPHSSVKLAKLLTEVLEEFELKRKVTAITMDNAINNRSMVASTINTLRGLNSSFDKSRHMPCMAHLFNIVVQDALKALGLSFGITPDEAMILTDETAEGAADRWVGSLHSLANIITRIRQLLAMIHASHLLRADYIARCELLKIDSKKLELDVKTRWNSTYTMLKKAHEKREVLAQIVKYELADKSGKDFIITEDEWKIVVQFLCILSPFKEASDIVCQSARVTASTVTDLIGFLKDDMSAQVSRLENGRMILSPNERAMLINICRVIRDKLEKYEAQIQGNIAFSLAAFLDPTVLIDSIRPEECGELVVYVRDLMEKADHDLKKASVQLSKERQQNPAQTGRSTSLDALPDDDQPTLSILERLIQKRPKPVQAEISVNTELETYLCMSKKGTEALQWWREEGCRQYPRLALLAKDFLPVCATSAPVERFFSTRKGVCAYRRGRPSGTNLSIFMTFKCWLRSEYPDSKEAKQLAEMEDDEELEEMDAEGHVQFDDDEDDDGEMSNDGW